MSYDWYYYLSRPIVYWHSMATEKTSNIGSQDKKRELRGFWLTRIVFLRSLAFIYCKYNSYRQCSDRFCQSIACPGKFIFLKLIIHGVKFPTVLKSRDTSIDLLNLIFRCGVCSLIISEQSSVGVWWDITNSSLYEQTQDPL